MTIFWFIIGLILGFLFGFGFFASIIANIIICLLPYEFEVNGVTYILDRK